MRLTFHHIRNDEQRAMAAARIAAIALKRNLSLVAFDAAQHAARAGLLAWGGKPQRSFAHPDVAVLVDIAAAQRSDFASLPIERFRMAQDLLSVMPRIFPLRQREPAGAPPRTARRRVHATRPWSAFLGNVLGEERALER